MTTGITRTSALLILVLSVLIIAISIWAAYAMPDPVRGASVIGAAYGASVGVFTGAYGLYALLTGRG